MEVEFLKMHGLGNDFLVVDERKKEKIEYKSNFAKRVCERRHAVGADGVLFLERSKDKDAKMRIFNSDGSEAETCINGLRCSAFALCVIDESKNNRINLETLAGPVKTYVEKLNDNLANVEIEVLGERRYLGEDSIVIDGQRYVYHFVDMGNPHAVIFLDNPVEDFPVEKVGHKIEYYDKFKPNRINVEFVNRINEGRLKMRVHERGSCETNSCGSGAFASVIAACESNLLQKDSWITVEQRGGELQVLYGKEMRLRGPVEISFKGVLSN